MEHQSTINNTLFRCESDGSWDKPGTWTRYYIDGNEVSAQLYDTARNAAITVENAAYDKAEEERKDAEWKSRNRHHADIQRY